MTELKPFKPLGDKNPATRKINRKVSRTLNRRQIPATDMMPKGVAKGLRMLFLILFIPVTLFAGVIDGICHGFLRFLDTGIMMYRRELEDTSWFR
jgi:hypothetical protein